jgi:hypothetical protein
MSDRLDAVMRRLCLPYRLRARRSAAHHRATSAAASWPYPRRTHPHVALLVRRQDYRHRLRMNRLDGGIRLSGQEAIDLVRSRDRLGLGAPVAVESRLDAGECEQWPIVSKREPNDVFFLGLWIGLGRVLGEAVGWHQASALRLEPSAPVRGRGVVDFGHRRTRRTWRWRHAPSHHRQLAAGVGVAHDRGRLVGEDAGIGGRLPT